MVYKVGRGGSTMVFGGEAVVVESGRGRGKES
jgi:hypothetical protein